MDTSEILTILERLRVAATLGDYAQVSQDQAALADRVRGVSTISQAAVSAGQGRWQAVLDAAGGYDAPAPELALFSARLRAEALIELGRTESGLDAARGLLADDPADAASRVLVGRALFRLRRMDDAEAELSRAIDQDPKSAEAHFGLGLVLMATGRLQPALDMLRLAQQLNPAHEGPYRAMARLFRMTGQVAEGADRIAGLLAGGLVQTPGLLMDLAELELLAGRGERVPPMLQTVQEHAALEPLHLIELARLWCEQAGLEAIQGLIATAGDMEHPKAAGALTVLQALEAELQGDGETARQLHGKACTQLQGHWFPHTRAALLYLYRPEPRSIAAAEAHLRQAVKLAPRTPDVRLMVAILKVAQGDHSVRPSLEMVAKHPGMRPSLRRLATATIKTIEAREAASQT